MRVFLLLCAARIASAASPVTALAFSPDGATLVSGSYKQVNVWDARTGKLTRHAGQLEGSVRAVAFRPQTNTVAVAAGVPGRTGAIAMVDLDSGETTPIAQSKDEMLAVAFSPDGKFLAFGGTDSTVQVWAFDERKVIATMTHADWVNGLAFSPDGKLLASGSADKTVGIWDTKTWKSLFQLPLTPSDAVNAVAFSPEGDALAYASDERAIRIWRTQNAFTEVDTSRPGRRNQLLQTRPLDTGGCVPLAVTWMKAPQRSRIVTACDDKTLRTVGPAGNQPVTLSGHTDWVYAVAASPDGTRIASGSGDGTVKIWGPGGRLLATLGEETK
jgi:WD40 repeat protein